MTSYATVDELATWTGKALEQLPDDADRLLERATAVIDEHTTTAVYTVDSNEDPTDTTVVAALRDATCAQVEFWLAGDEEDDILGPVQALAVGGLQIQPGAGDTRISPTYLAPRAWRALRNCAAISW